MKQPLKQYSSAGYTLVEILIVLFIISIVTSVALLSISRNETKKLQSFTNEFAQVMTLASEQAMLQPVVLGLSVQENSFHFSSLKTDAEMKTSWVPLDDTLLGKHPIPSNVEVQVNVNQAATDKLSKDSPQIMISTNGDMTPFTIYVGKKGDKPRFAIIGNADGSVSTKSLS